MRKTLFLLALAIPSAFAMPAHAADETAQAPSPNKTICRKVAKTGSILPEKVCLTSAEWAEVKKRRLADEESAAAQNRKLDPSARMSGGGTPYDISGGAGAFH